MKHILQTERLRLIPFNVDDFDLLHSTFTHPFVRKYLWDDEVIGAEKAREILLLNERHFDRDSWGLWKIVITNNDAYAGIAGLWMFFDESQPQLLYGLLPHTTGFGYATEASKVIIDYAFHKLGFEYLLAACDTPHERSKKVCERLQMKIVEEKEMNDKWTTFYRINK